ncbi:MAG: sodium/solute symporter [Kiritimatiellae bacterium]|nr:sodium/solute symporter [Kiritimatiellia bacterium]
MGVLDLLVFVGFIAAVLAVGMLKSRHEGDSEAYFLAGRGLTWWLIGISLIAANISAEQFVGMSGSAANYLGIAIASYEWMAAITLVVVAFAFLPYFLRAGIYTIPEFLEHRYNHWARLIMAVFMMIILIGVSLSGVIYAGALTMRDLLRDNGYSISLVAACWVMGLIAAAYVAFGGLKACAWADLIQGSALVLGGGAILFFTLRRLGAASPAELVDGAGAAVAVLPEGGWARLLALNRAKLHMVLPRTDLNIPWTALVVGLWIPNFYYWGLNQYITQRVLGSASLREGQKGIVFAAALKLLIPFIIVFPGMAAFNLFSGEMAARAEDDFVRLVESAMASANSTDVFELPPDLASRPKLAPLAARIELHNAAARERATAAGRSPTIRRPVSHKHDSALALLIGRLVPRNRGVMGFVLAAMLGAIVSSLAAVLNAASTIFTMDVFAKYLKRDASQRLLVAMGRICVGVFVVIGCVISPLLDDPRFGGIFKYIQEFQGYVSPGILAVFVFGLLNRRAPGIAGVVGLLLNPILYGLIAWRWPSVAFLDRMAICFFAVMAVMQLIGWARPLPQPVEFRASGRVDVRSSRGAMVFGGLVVLVTLGLYIAFW